MDLNTKSKNDFLQSFVDTILAPRGLNYKLQFPGPTGANAVEAAIKLARKVTKRTNIIAFTNAFHGCTLGALALTGSSVHRQASMHQLSHVSRAPYDGYFGTNFDSVEYIRKLLSDVSSGFDLPAAIICETVQGEGGLNKASSHWIRALRALCSEYEILFIVDEIQTGCGRTGTFFSFEALGVIPDIVCLAKSISGFGMPMSMVLLKPEYIERQRHAV